ncbi:MAG: hypothetical protein HY054_13385 [Proteobacteria bacterium]|nr:hypothetical protein [Pseudomonadota bacterium]
MDLAIWSAKQVTLLDCLPQSTSWKTYSSEFGTEYQFEGEGWLISVQSLEEGEADDAVAEKLPDARYMIGLGLEPIEASPSGYLMLEQVTRAIAEHCDGVWVDPSGNAFRYNEGAFE